MSKFTIPEYEPFTYTEFKSSDIEKHFDPENNFFNNIQTNCSYYDEDFFNKQFIGDKEFSIIHVNCRSLSANFEQLINFIGSVRKKFDIIAISETWLNSEPAVDFSLPGYNMYTVNRENARGGGVAIYINNCIKHNIINNVSKSVDGTAEFVTVECFLKNKKNYC